MSTFNFTDGEKQAIRDAISIRKSQCNNEFYNNHLKDLDKIEAELDLGAPNLTPKSRSIIIGCLREVHVYPNEEILNLSEYQLIFRKEELASKLEELDFVFSLLNRLLKKSETKYRLFSVSLSKIEKILRSNKVLYSKTTTGKIYKTGILIDSEEGVPFELEGYFEPTNFVVGQLSAQSYMGIATPSETRQLMKDDYSKNHELTVMQESFINILERMHR